MSSLICGSLAYDNIMQYEGRFAEALLADQLHKVNVSFLVPTMRREFGGCAGNIAYNLKLLGGEPIVMATVGLDSAPYMERFAALDISTRCVRQIESSFTAQCFITTDADSNQITAFHPGAMTWSHENKVADAGAVKFAIVAPDGRDGMLQHAQQAAELKIPLIFDPGQGMPMFDGNDLKNFIDLATYVAVNDYEAELLTARTGLSLAQIAERVTALVVTRGELGADIFVDGKHHAIPCVKADKIADPTGCGDAFRAGMLFGLTEGYDWETTGRLASLMGSIKIASQGPQNHAPSKAEIEERFHKAFGYRFG
ncbi:carbohydrate kinase family protein [Herbaspirillum huttiense]|jgi:adenosine kinase|uniref:Carbohydrate kinase family protein n=1 Tax=Herbaspirillum huttiense subsp. lycopersici TaxID=3074428 RepID=A0ABU2ENU7_9BURK|nr:MULTISPECIES: carbohydrate kinase family protein [Herbaspirillum]MAF02948.1 carbohydrate kinase family protein [Herbaspirillum sp.]MBN9354962.1 carbohydrate kinase family protein [Herbaspirillum huttiense]MBO18656.1 carbohydrate kinase family protein [Herbaspirillum sp.]MBP1314730.1 adenosine kinase [Herbaspirillum sp. 1130]MCO4858699.1 carbohydrate kinase family protein [Herbaspirillum sp. WGmk3]|tara:strand:- start:1062 stop:1997 length:936 start_codon:yes stop_codon:yes gene_type:complete